MDTQLRGLVHAFLEQQGLKKAAKAMAKELKKKGLPAPPLEAHAHVGLAKVVEVAAAAAQSGGKKRGRNDDSSSSSSSSSSDSSSSDSDSDGESAPAKKTKTTHIKSKSTSSSASASSSSSSGSAATTTTTSSARDYDTGFSSSADPASNAYRKKHAMKLDSDVDFAPFQTFDVVRQHLPHALLDVACKGFTSPTPIQAQAWPVLCQMRDVIGIAETGSGKTLAFMLPAVARLGRKASERKRGDSPRILVVAPTRELAMQSAEVAAAHSAIEHRAHGVGEMRNLQEIQR